MAFGSLFNSQRLLLALTQAGVSREDAYALVQRNAVRAWHAKANPGGAEAKAAEGAADPFGHFLAQDAAITKALPKETLAEFTETARSLAYHLAQADTIFERVFESETKT